MRCRQPNAFYLNHRPPPCFTQDCQPLNANRKTVFVVLAIAIATACVFIFEGIYQEAKKAAIAKLDQQEMIYAHQAARGIEEFFATWTATLATLSQMPAVAEDDREGRAVLKLFYETNRARIMEITRVDEKGVIRDDFPDGNAVGLDISQQSHMVTLLRGPQAGAQRGVQDHRGSGCDCPACSRHAGARNSKDRWKSWSTSTVSRSAISMWSKWAQPVTPG